MFRAYYHVLCSFVVGNGLSKEIYPDQIYVVVFTDKRINYSCTNIMVSNIFNVLPEKPNITYPEIAMLLVYIVNFQTANSLKI